MSHRTYIGLGSNLADPQQQLRSALDALAQLPGTQLAGVSAFYTSCLLYTSPSPRDS